jgi:hypothetical protein
MRKEISAEFQFRLRSHLDNRQARSRANGLSDDNKLKHQKLRGIFAFLISIC